MEWITPETAHDWRAQVRARGEVFEASCEGGEGWRGQLGYVGMCYGKEVVSGSYYCGGQNSLNEAGLSISTHALRGVGTHRPQNASRAVCFIDFASWVATNFFTVAGVVKALESVAVLADGPGTLTEPGLQWAITDVAGDSIVVDYSGGSLHIYNNTGVGVLTNDPEYPWHVRNLNNYIGLSMDWPDGGDGIAVNTEFGQVPSPVGHGQNLLGLPGDLTPSSRFVRTFFMRSYAMRAKPPTSIDDALILASGILNSQYIVKGYNALRIGEAGYDYTQFSILQVPSERLFFYRTYESTQWRRVNLSALNFEHAATSKPAGGFSAVDVTSELQSANAARVTEQSFADGFLRL